MAVRNVIEIRGLTKRYGSLTAIENITFEVRRGELFGLIGPDGAGKTTLFRLLATLLNPDDGVATVDGFENGWDICRGVFRFIPICRLRKILNFLQPCSG